MYRMCATSWGFGAVMRTQAYGMSTRYGGPGQGLVSRCRFLAASCSVCCARHGRKWDAS